MNCAYCQLELKREAHHCPRCGAPVEAVGASSGGADEARLRAVPVELDERTTMRSRLTPAAPTQPGYPPADEGPWTDAGLSPSAHSAATALDRSGQSNIALSPAQEVPSASVATVATTWLPTDTRTVVLWGLAGGVIAALSTEVYWWAADAWLTGLPSALRVAFVGWGIAAPIATTHALFVGSKVGKPGATIATIAITAVPFTIVASFFEPMLFGFEGGPSFWLDIVKYAVVGMLLVGVVGEVAQVMLKRLPDSLPIRALMGLSPIGGWMAFALVQRMLPVFGYPYGAEFGAGEWLMWVLSGAAFGYVFSGLVPAAILRRQAPLRSVQSIDGRAGAATVLPVGAPSSVGTPAQPPASQLEHPKANTVLILGIVGMVAFAPLAIGAWVSGAKAIREVREHPGQYRASGALQAGYVLGIIGTVLWILGILVLVVVYGAVFSAMQ